MTALDRIATSLGRHDEVPNQLLAKELAENNDEEGVRIIAAHLWDKNTNIQSDCLKVLYELGKIKPELVANFYNDFLKLLNHRNNRLVWGAMIALSAIAAIKADELFLEIGRIKSAMQEGSVITIDIGIKTMALIGSVNPDYRREIIPFLFDHLNTCRSKDVPQHAEHTLMAIGPENQIEYVNVLKNRFPNLSPAGLTKVKKIIKKLELDYR